MNDQRGFTNESYKKRVDHQAGAHRAARAPREPAVCASCFARYENRRWTAAADVHEDNKHLHWKPAFTTICPACKQIESQVPGGYLNITGAFFDRHRDEIEHLLRNQATHAAQDNPLARIISWEPVETGGLNITTTTEHLVQRLGRALEKAYDGETKYDFSHENKLARVSWHRDK